MTRALLHESTHSADSSECWWFGSRKRQSRHHFVRCRAWAPQSGGLWKKIGKDCGWRHPRAPTVRLLWREGATEAVLEFLRGTRVGCARSGQFDKDWAPERWVGKRRTGWWTGPALGCIGSCISFVSFSSFAVFWGVMGEGDQGATTRPLGSHVAGY